MMLVLSPQEFHQERRTKVGCMMHSTYATVAVLIMVSAWSASAHAVDEIQVYNAEIANVGEWTVQQHLNYAISGRKVPDFPGGLVPNHALNGTPEFAYGITNWWE